MLQEQTGSKRLSDLCIVAAFGIITMSSNLSGHSNITLNNKPYYETKGCFSSEETICNSSTLSKNAVGDIVSCDRVTDFVQNHDKINVTLHITKIHKHVSSFDFEDEYEEI